MNARSVPLRLEDLVLLGSQARTPLLVRELGLRVHGPSVALAGQSTTSDSATNWVAAAAITST